MTQTRLTRRSMLRGLGVAIALPFLEAMLPRRARGQSAKTPLRFMGWFHPNGFNADMWTPTTEGTGFTLPPTLAPLLPVQDYVLVLSGLTLAGPGVNLGSHTGGEQALFTSVAKIVPGATNSIDQLIAQKLGTQTAVPSLQLGIELNGYYDPITDAGNGFIASPTASFDDTKDYCDSDDCKAAVVSGSRLPNMYNPRLVFQQLFGAAPGGMTGSSSSSSSSAKSDAYRKSILDTVTADASRLSQQLGTADKALLDQYLTGVRQIETSLQNASSLQSCAPGTQPIGIPFTPQARARLMCDLVVKAFQCDATRVATMMLGRTTSPMNFTVDGVSYSHHNDASHWGTDPVKKHAKDYIDNWQVSQLAYLLQQMKAITEPGGTMLDNVAIFYSSDVADPNLHNQDNMPVLLAGRAGGAFRTGRHIKTGIAGRTTGDLFLAILSAFGIQQTKFGDFGTSALGGLS
jgi:hypothetical protein